MVTFHQKKTLLFNVRVIRDVLFHEVSVKCTRLGSSDVSADVKDNVQKYRYTKRFQIGYVVSDVLEIQNIDTAHMS